MSQNEENITPQEELINIPDSLIQEELIDTQVNLNETGSTEPSEEELIDIPMCLSEEEELIDIPEFLQGNIPATYSTRDSTSATASAGASSRVVGCLVGEDGCTILNQCLTAEACNLCESEFQCTSCQTTCELTGQTCDTTCELSCQNDCQNSCQDDCESACQDCQDSCQTGASCEDACESACQNCQSACETGTSCETTCESACQDDCQLSCQHACESACQDCQDTCQLSCQNCQGVACQTCQDTCQLYCQNCQGVACQTCQDTCQLYCQNCQGVACQTCQDTCQLSCQNCQGVACQTCQDACQYACQDCQGACELTAQRPNNWAWTSSVGQGIQVSYLNNSPWYLTAQEWNNFTARINSFRSYKGLSITSFTLAVKGQPMKANQANEAINAIKAMNPPTAVPSTVSSGSSITAAFINGLANSLNSIK